MNSRSMGDGAGTRWGMQPACLPLSCLAAALMGLPAPSDSLGAELSSPNGQLALRFDVRDWGSESGCLVYSLDYRGETAIEPSRLGLELANTMLLSGFEIADQSTASHDTTWQPVYGERSAVRDRYNQLSVDLRREGGVPSRLRIDFRAYDEGIALAYEIPAQDGAEEVTIRRERTEFRFASDHPAWAVYSAQGVYERVALTDVRKGCERPLVVEAGPERWLTVAEARLVDYARMKLDPVGGGSPGLVSALDGDVHAHLAGGFKQTEGDWVDTGDHQGFHFMCYGSSALQVFDYDEEVRAL